ncbi:MAG: phospholipase A [Oleiagrimonas sp.]|nr:phospholipase A [Oleiagrimonas sp.]MDA3915331.1 phospholipase A [Oleiagrimonas sp.]
MGALAFSLQIGPLYAQTAHPSDPFACAGIANDSLRLACYDRAVGRTLVHDDETRSVQQDNAIPAQQSTTRSASSGRKTHSTDSLKLQHLFDAERLALKKRARPVDKGTPHTSLLNSRWELDPNSKLGPYTIRGYKPVYVMPLFYMTSVNNTPSSPSPGHTVSGSENLQHEEAKFQLSFKTKIWEGVFGKYGDLWLAYTQDSHWQVYNGRNSRPFRETNYEPEAMLVFDTNYHVLGWRGHLLGIGLNHQSNGRSNPLSRSWNRIVADIGFERGPWTLMIRPWWRIPENRAHDDNPNISDYMGRAEVQLVREWRANEFTLMGRHSLRRGSHSHGAMEFTWAFPIHDNLRGYVQVFNGYGESLIDYNHRATYVGLGVSLLGWY